MRFSNNAKINNNLKVAYKSVLLFIIIFVTVFDLVHYILGVSNKGWIFDWNGELTIYGKNGIGMIISNYFFNFSTAINFVAFFYLWIATIGHRRESRHWFQNYPFGLFLVISYLYSTITFLSITIPLANHITALTWISSVFGKILLPVLFFVYVVVFMENKSWYGIKESIVKYGIKIFSSFLLVIFTYYLFWLSKYNNGLDLYNLKYADIFPTNVGGIKFDYDSLLKWKNYIPNTWNNHDVIVGERLFHFSNSKVFEFGMREWTGVIFAIIIFGIFSFGIVPLITMLNNLVIASPKYIVSRETHLDRPQVVDYRDETDSMEVSQEIVEF